MCKIILTEATWTPWGVKRHKVEVSYNVNKGFWKLVWIESSVQRQLA